MNLANARWRKSSVSGSDTKDGDCVEVAFIPGSVGVRDTKNRDAGLLVFPEHGWRLACTRLQV